MVSGKVVSAQDAWRFCVCSVYYRHFEIKQEGALSCHAKSYINSAVAVRTIFSASTDLQIAIFLVVIAQSKSYNFS